VPVAVSGWKELIESGPEYIDLLYPSVQTAFRAKRIGLPEIEYWKGRVVDGSDSGLRQYFLIESLRIAGGDRAVLETWKGLERRYPDRVYFQNVLASIKVTERNETS